MLILEILFWLSLFIIFYAYIGYGILLFLIVRIKRLFTRKRPPQFTGDDLPEATLLIAAYNEADIMDEKIKNTFELDYPKGKLQLLFITDGSDDGTPDIIKKYPEIKLMHQNERKGKIAAVTRAMKEVKTPVVIYTDANTFLNKEALINIARHYADPRVGAVAGEKRIKTGAAASASGAGEGIYWKYESTLKKWDSELYSIVGAAGELFSIRTDLFEPVPADTIIEDFYLTLSIARKGYRVSYEPEASATETPSASVKEELKRKIRIAAGGLQAIARLTPLLNPFRYGVLSFQYISHRVLRWTIAPAALVILMVANILLASYSSFYQYLLYAQILFYLAVIIGFILERKKIKIKAFFIPYYFFIMNYAVYMGFLRFISKKQSVLWEKAKRS